MQVDIVIVGAKGRGLSCGCISAQTEPQANSRGI
jgi:hypothetical protein